MTTPWAACLFLLLPGLLCAVQLGEETVRAFNRHVRQREAQIEARAAGDGFLWVDGAPGRVERVRQGQVLSQPGGRKGEIKVPGGLIHDWVGAVFIPGATLDATLALVQDYDRHKQIYRPEVVDSRLLSRNGDEFQVFLRLLKKKVVTVVLNTEHHARYFRLDGARCHSRSYSTRIAEVKNPGGGAERELPPGNDRGFLWRLYSYWRFQERDGGVYVECEAISLTRSVPGELAWLIDPIIRKLPPESLANMLRATRQALSR